MFGAKRRQLDASQQQMDGKVDAAKQGAQTSSKAADRSLVKVF